MIARNFRRFPEALTRQLVLAFERAVQGIAAAVARAFALLPAGCAPRSVPFLREPARRQSRAAYRALDVPGMWWHNTAPMF